MRPEPITRLAALYHMNSLPLYYRNMAANRTVITALMNPGRKVACGKRIDTPSGVHTSVSWRRDVERVFNSMNFFAYVSGNSSPRRGRAWDYVMVLTD